jgi:hypothetical protein
MAGGPRGFDRGAVSQFEFRPWTVFCRSASGEDRLKTRHSAQRRVWPGAELKVLETHRPLVEWTGLAGLICRRVVVLAEPRRAIAVLTQDPADGDAGHADDTVVSGESGGLEITPKPAE